jgi:hypothetical protein
VSLGDFDGVLNEERRFKWLRKRINEVEAATAILEVVTATVILEPKTATAVILKLNIPVGG